MTEIVSLASVIARARETAREHVDEDAIAADEAAKEIETRRERLDVYRASLPDDDVERIVRGELDSRAVQVVRRWLTVAEARGMRFLWLTGSTGTGKTVACASVVAERGGMVVLGTDLVRIFRSNYREHVDARDRMLRHHTLVLDDIGTRAREDEQDALFTVINGRQGAGKVTLISSNLTRAEVEAYDARIIDRIRARGAIVETTGASLRRAVSP